MSYASDMKKELTLIEITKDREFLSELSALIKMNGVLNISNGRLNSEKNVFFNQIFL